MFTNLKSLYLNAAIITFNTLLLLVGLVVAAWVLSPPPKRLHVYSKHFVPASYTKTTPQERELVSDEFDRMGDRESFSFAPWTVFISRPFVGKLLNVADDHTRFTPPSPARGRTPEYVVWAFGGSTMFGWGVADRNTIAAQLQTLLNSRYPTRQITVRNFGQPYFYSSMELAYFQAMLRALPRPDVAIFLDGLNDSLYLLRDIDYPWFTDAATRGWESERLRRYHRAEGIPWIQFNETFPLFNLIVRLRALRAPGDPANDPLFARKASVAHLASAVNIFLLNLRMRDAVGMAAGVSVKQYLQPVKFIDRPDPSLESDPSREFYNRLLATKPANLIVIGDAVKDLPYPYVDHSHYSDDGCLRVAERIANYLNVHP